MKQLLSFTCAASCAILVANVWPSAFEQYYIGPSETLLALVWELHDCPTLANVTKGISWIDLEGEVSTELVGIINGRAQS